MHQKNILTNVLISLLCLSLANFASASIGFVDTQKILKEAPQAKRGEEQKKVIEAANLALKKYAEQKNIYVIVQAAVYASPRVNITDYVLNVLNEQNIDSLGSIIDSPRIGFVETEKILREARDTWGSQESEGDRVSRVNRAIREIALAENLDLIFQEAVHASNSASITEKVIEKIRGNSSGGQRVGVNFDLKNIKFIGTERLLREAPKARLAQKSLENEFKEREINLRTLAETSSSKYEIAREEFMKELNKRRNEELAKVVSDTNMTIRQVAERDGIDLIFQSVVYASPLVDMTDLTLTELVRLETTDSHNQENQVSNIHEERTSQPTEDIKSKKRLALLIGNAKYKSSPLANPINDVRGMSAALRKVGFTVLSYENLDFKQMRNAVRDFGEKLTKDHVGLFYYSGHGVQVEGKNYLIPVNSDIKYEDEVASSALDAEMVLAKLESVKNSLNIVVLDACRDSPLGRRTRTSTKGLSNMNAASGTLIAFSTAPGSVALDGKGSNSPYTKHLINAIQKEGLLLEQVFKEVRGNVIKETNGSQVPWENSSILGDFYFTQKRFD